MGETTEVCVVNIGPRERRRRARFGYVLFAVGALALVALAFARVNSLFGLLLFVPYAAACSGFFQAREKT